MRNFFVPHPEKDLGNLHFQNVKSELLAARYSKNWQDFTHCQSTNLNFGKKNDQERDKRIRRVLLVGHAMEALEEVPPDLGAHTGKMFGKNDWGMGPAYSWNTNYLRDNEI